MTSSNSVDTWERLVRFHRATTKAMDDRLRAESGRSLDDYDVLHQVHSHGGPIRMGELAERLLVANSSCNRIVGRLVDDGLLERTHGTVDRREVLIALTAAGSRQWRRMAVVHTRDIEAHLGALLSPTQLRQLHEALEALSTSAEGPTP